MARLGREITLRGRVEPFDRAQGKGWKNARLGPDAQRVDCILYPMIGKMCLLSDIKCVVEFRLDE